MEIKQTLDCMSPDCKNDLQHKLMSNKYFANPVISHIKTKTMISILYPLPVSSGPGIEEANALMSYNLQVGTVILLVTPNVFQHVMWYGD